MGKIVKNSQPKIRIIYFTALPIGYSIKKIVAFAVTMFNEPVYRNNLRTVPVQSYDKWQSHANTFQWYNIGLRLQNTRKYFDNVEDFLNICHSRALCIWFAFSALHRIDWSIESETNKSMIGCVNMVQSNTVKALLASVHCTYSMCPKRECVDVIDERQHRKHIAVLEETLNSFSAH